MLSVFCNYTIKTLEIEEKLLAHNVNAQISDSKIKKSNYFHNKLKANSWMVFVYNKDESVADKRT